MPPPTRGDLPDDVFDVLQRQVRFCLFFLSLCFLFFMFLLVASEEKSSVAHSGKEWERKEAAESGPEEEAITDLEISQLDFFKR